MAYVYKHNLYLILENLYGITVSSEIYREIYNILTDAIKIRFKSLAYVKLICLQACVQRQRYGCSSYIMETLSSHEGRPRIRNYLIAGHGQEEIRYNTVWL